MSFLFQLWDIRKKGAVQTFNNTYQVRMWCCVHIQYLIQSTLGGVLTVIWYSGKLLRENAVANFVAISSSYMVCPD